MKGPLFHELLPNVVNAEKVRKPPFVRFREQATNPTAP